MRVESGNLESYRVKMMGALALCLMFLFGQIVIYTALPAPEPIRGAFVWMLMIALIVIICNMNEAGKRLTDGCRH